jgi:hypothetical protein
MLKNGAGSGQVPFLLAEQRREWSLMIFCARATRGLRRPSLDARSGRSISPHHWRSNEQAQEEHYRNVLVRYAQEREASATPLMRGMRSRKILAAASLDDPFEHPHYMMLAWSLAERKGLTP